MKNFVKTSSEFVNSSIVVNETLMPRSLVLVNSKTMAVFNVAAKCRNSDKFSVCRALAKAVLTALAKAQEKNTTEAAMEAKKRVVNPFTSALSCHVVLLTDKNGAIIPNSGMSVLNDDDNNNVTLRSVFRFTKQQPLYKLVVEQGLDWSNEQVVKALNMWTTAAIEQMDYTKELDEALGKAADSTEKLEKAEEKAAQKNTEKTAA